MHSNHPDIHEHGLQDNCIACEEHAENPFRSLDTEMLSNLIVLTIRMRRGEPVAPRSENEAIARAQVMNALEQAGKMFEVMAWGLQTMMILQYFQDYWKINLID